MSKRKCVYIDEQAEDEEVWDGEDENIVTKSFIRISFNKEKLMNARTVDYFNKKDTDESSITKLCDNNRVIEFEL